MYYRSHKQLMLFNYQEEIYQKLECDSNVHDIYQFIPSHLHSYTLTKLLLDLLHNSIGLDLVVGHLGLHHLPALLLLVLLLLLLLLFLCLGCDLSICWSKLLFAWLLIYQSRFAERKTKGEQKMIFVLLIR